MSEPAVPSAAADTLPPDVQCPCGHAADEHDSLAARYCRATVTGDLDRGCMCVLAAMPLPQ